MAKRIVGLDIGRETLRAVEVENPDKSRPTAVRCGEASIPLDSVQSGEVREVNTVAAAMRSLWGSSGIKTKNVVIGMGNQRVLAREIAVPRMSQARIKESLPFQVQDMLPVPVAQTLLDFYPVSEGQGEQGPVIHGLLIAALKDAVAANVAAVRRAGLNPVRVDIIPFALSRLNFRERNARGTFAAIDVGATTTNIVISTAGVPQFVRMIPVGGDETTSALANTLSIGRGQAESLKRARGLTPPNNFDGADPRVADAIRTSVNELLVALKNTILYYLNSRPGEMIQGIVLSGGGSSMSGFAAAVGEATKIPVTIADPFSTVDLSRGLRNRGVANSAEYSVALGLALGGTE